jgi:hypothetical protein
VKLTIVPTGDETFSIAGIHHKATRFRAKVELGGITGMIGGQPSPVRWPRIA